MYEQRINPIYTQNMMNVLYNSNKSNTSVGDFLNTKINEKMLKSNDSMHSGSMFRSNRPY